MAMIPFFSNQEPQSSITIDYKQSRDVDNDIYNIAFYCAEEKRLGHCNRDCDVCPFDVRKHTDKSKAMLLRTRAEVDRNNYLYKLDEAEAIEKGRLLGTLILWGIKFVGIAAICIFIGVQCRSKPVKAATATTTTTTTTATATATATATTKVQPGEKLPKMPYCEYYEDMIDWLHTPAVKRRVQNTPGIISRDKDKQCLAWAIWAQYYFAASGCTKPELWTMWDPNYHVIIKFEYADGDWWFKDPNYKLDDMDSKYDYAGAKEERLWCAEHKHNIKLTNETGRWYLDDYGSLVTAW